jgi:hypothetical protein
MFPAVAALFLLSSLIFGNPLTANSADLAQAHAAKALAAPQMLAQASTSPATTQPAPAPSETNPAVEKRIRSCTASSISRPLSRPNGTTSSR